MNTIGKIIRESHTPTTDTVYYYPLNGNYKDHSLNNLPDATDNGCEFVMDAKVGNMIKFDKENQKFLTLPSRTNFLNNLYHKTISYILLVQNIYSEQSAILNLGEASGFWSSCAIIFNKRHPVYSIISIKPCIYMDARGSNSNNSVEIPICSNKPVLITQTIQAGETGNEMRVCNYVDGRLIKKTGINHRISNLYNNNSFLGKALWEGQTYYSDVILAEFILEGRIWTEIEVSDYARSIGF